MAKYTELYLDYVSGGGAIPAAFSLIDGFSDLFLQKYGASEIGFETEAIFALKLESRANLVMGDYAERIRLLAQQYAKIDAPAKTIYENSTLTRNTGARKSTSATDYGAQESTSTELPFNAQNAEPSIKNNTGAKRDANETNTDASTDSETREFNRNEGGASLDEVLRSLDYLNGRVKHVLEECLGEFKPLFMGIY